MKKILAVLSTLVSLTAQADNLIKPGATDDSQARYMYLKDSTGATVPAVVVYTSDGSGNIIPLSSSGLATTVSQGNAGSSGQAWFVQATTLPLPTNAAQESGGHLASIDSKTLTAGQKTMAASAPVVIASDQSPIPITGNITASNASVGVTGSTAPTSSNLIGGKDGSGNLAAVTVVSGAMSVNGSAFTQPISAATLPLSTGAATSALQTTGNASLTSLDSKLPASVGGKVPVDGSGVTQPISASALPLPTGAATESTLVGIDDDVDAINAKLNSLGQKTMSGSMPVTMASDQTPITIQGVVSLANPIAGLIGATAPIAAVQLGGPDNTNKLQAITVNSGALKVDPSSFTAPVAVSSSVLPTGAATSALQITGNTSLSSIDGKTPSLVGGKVPVDGSGVTQPISASSLPLPAGAATASGQATAQTTLTSINNKIPAQGAAAIAASTPVNIASDQVVPVSASSLPLPTGAATETTLALVNTHANSLDSKINTQGQKTMAASTPVVLASDQSAIPISGSVTSTNASIGTNGAAIPSSSTQVAGKDASGNLTPLNITAGGAVKTDSSATTQPVSIAGTVGISGTVTSNIGTTGGLSLDATTAETHGAKAPGTAASKSDLAGMVYTAAGISIADGQQAAIQSDSTGHLLTNTTGTVAVSNFPSTQPISGTVTANEGGAPWTQSIVQGGNTATVSAAGALKVDGSASTQPISGTVVANAGTGNFNVIQATGTNLHTVVDSGALTANIGTTNGLALDATVSTVQGSVAGGTAGTKSGLAGGVYNTSAPTLTNGQQVALQLNVSGSLKTDSSATTQPVSGTVAVSNFPATQPVSGSVSVTNFPATQPVSGTVTANIGTTNGLALDATVSGLQATTGSAVPSKATFVAGKDTSGNLQPFALTTGGKALIEGGNATAVKTDSSATTQPISGTVTANAGTGNFTVVQGTGTNLHTVVDSGTVTANIGTTNGLALDASVNGLQVSQASTTSGQKGGLSLGAVTTAAPTYTTATSNSLSLTTAGALRTDASATTQPISASALPLPSNAAQETGGNIAAINAKLGSLGQKAMAGSAPVVIASDQSAIPASESGVWNNRIQDTAGTGINSLAIGGAQYLDVVLPSNATPGSAVPSRSNEMAGQDGSGNARNVSTDTSGNVNVNNISEVTPVDRTSSGSLTAACASGSSCAGGTTVVLSTNGTSATTLNISGTWSGTVGVDCSSDSFSTFKTLWLANKTGGSPSMFTASSGYFEAVSAAACPQVRARMTAFTSGTAVVQMIASSATGIIQVVSPSAGQFFTTTNLSDGNGTVINSNANSLNVNTKTALTANAPGSATIATTSALFLAANASRKGLIVTNLSTQIECFAIGTAAILNSGICLFPGSVWNMKENDFTVGAINAIAGAASSASSYQEFQ